MGAGGSGGDARFCLQTGPAIIRAGMGGVGIYMDVQRLSDGVMRRMPDRLALLGVR
jgi:hypothetical protein